MSVLDRIRKEIELSTPAQIDAALAGTGDVGPGINHPQLIDRQRERVIGIADREVVALWLARERLDEFIASREAVEDVGDQPEIVLAAGLSNACNDLIGLALVKMLIDSGNHVDSVGIRRRMTVVQVLPEGDGGLKLAKLSQLVSGAGPIDDVLKALGVVRDATARISKDN